MVDDEPAALDIYTAALQMGLQDTFGEVVVHAASSVETALSDLEGFCCDVLVVDLKMPGPDGDPLGGRSIIAASLDADPARPIIVVTGHGSVPLARETLAKGVFDFIEKTPDTARELVVSVHRAVAAAEDRALRAGNPFTPSAGREPTFLAGRRAELEFFDERLRSALRSGRREHFVLLGEPGIGKSALLKEYKKLAQDRHHLAVCVPMSPLDPGARILDAVRSMVEGILLDLPFPVNRLRRVAELVDSLGVNVMGSGVEIRTRHEETHPQTFLHNALTQLWRDIEDKTDLLVILLDDVTNLAPAGEAILTLKQTLQMESVQRCPILVGLASTYDEWNRLVAPDVGQSISRHFLSRGLEPLSTDDVRDCLRHISRHTGVSFSPEVRERIIFYAQGHPLKLQVLGHHLFHNKRARRVDMEMWDKAFERALDDMARCSYDPYLGQCSDEERSWLMRLSLEEPSRGAWKRVPIFTGEAQPPIRRLMERRLAVQEGGQYRLADRMLRDYLRSARRM